ncbi:MAG: type II secretion system protein GspN [Leptospiraceae bacterium]|nr:type II secretion system protein GspN [Leptospiraceae bacterium]
MAELETTEDKELENVSEEDSEQEEDLELEEEESHLSLKQKLWLGLIGLIGFLFFFIIFFPLEEIIKSYVIKTANENQINLDFKNLNLSIFSSSQIDKFYLLTQNDIEVKSEEIEFDISFTKLMNKQIIGTISATSFSLDMGSTLIKLKRLDLSPNVQNYEKGLATNGSLEVQTAGGQIVKLPNFPILGDLSGVQIKSINLAFKKTGSSLQIEKAMLNLSIAKIQIKGKIEIAQNFMNSNLDIQVCPTLTPEFALEREDLANILAAIAKGSEACIPVRGTIQSPQANLQQFGGTN